MIFFDSRLYVKVFNIEKILKQFSRYNFQQGNAHLMRYCCSRDNGGFNDSTFHYTIKKSFRKKLTRRVTAIKNTSLHSWTLS